MDNKTTKIAWITLLVLGGLDLLRGFMHTVALDYAAANIAGVTDPDAIFLLRAFGISNYVTGALFILIALQAKQLAPYALTLIPVCYGLGIAVSPPVAQVAQFGGKYFMMVYLALSLLIGVWSIIQQNKSRPSSQVNGAKDAPPNSH